MGEISGNQTGNETEIFRTTKDTQRCSAVYKLDNTTCSSMQLTCGRWYLPNKIQCSAGEATSSSSKLMTQNPEHFVNMRSPPAFIQHTASKEWRCGSQLQWTANSQTVEPLAKSNALKLFSRNEKRRYDEQLPDIYVSTVETASLKGITRRTLML